jgi:hypothetical protein
MINKLRELFFKRKMLNVQQFAHAHRDFLVIVCDPRDDTMFMSYRDKQVTGKIRSNDGINHRVVKNVLKHSTFDREIDRLLGGIIDVLRCPLNIGNHFYSFIDGALFNITKSIKKEKSL